MSDTAQGDGWWQASDGKWYPPEQHPDYKPPPPPPDAPPPPTQTAAGDSVDESKGLFGKLADANDRYQERVVAPLQERANKAAEKAAGPASMGGAVFQVREEGKNGRVEITADRLIRTRKKTVGKDDIQTIPLKAITSVSHDRKTLGTDIVHLTAGPISYEWKVANAEQMVAILHERMFDL